MVELTFTSFAVLAHLVGLLTFVRWMLSAPFGRLVVIWGLSASVAGLTLLLLVLHLRMPDAEWQGWVSPQPPVSTPSGKRTFSDLFWALQLFLAGAAGVTAFILRRDAVLNCLSVYQIRALLGLAVLTGLSWFVLLL